MNIKFLKKEILKTFALLPVYSKKYTCSICKNDVNFFLNYGIKTELFVSQKIIGGGYRKHVRCPICQSNDRIRWIDWVIENKTYIYTGAFSILHIAPEPCIEKKIRKNMEVKYTTGDIQCGVAEEVVDITKMKFENNSFDYIILNHVLEHVEDEKNALQEIRRTLKVGGKVLFSMPICENRKTYEHKGILSKRDRLQYYGQEDHVRLYGMDVVERFEGYGFKVKEYIVSDYLSEKQINIMKLIKKDRVYIGEAIKGEHECRK